jgi:hypothetical protein
MSRSLLAVAVAMALFVPSSRRASAGVSASAFDHEYRSYATVLKAYVRGARVDYAALEADQASLDRVVAEFDSPEAQGEAGWTREQRMAFWINAYNALTLRAVVDHYPIRSRWFTRAPRNSIRQIDGVWTELRWRAAGRTVTLDDIEHVILRPTFKDARVHFALNCASISCPQLGEEPYRAHTLTAQLVTAARRYLGGPEGVRVMGDTLHVSSIFKWYGDDFIEQYAPVVPGSRSAGERGILGALVQYGPSAAADRARSGRSPIRYLSYDWSLNDLQR